MINIIKRNPILAAVLYFLLTCAVFPLVAFHVSHVMGITFIAALTLPYLIAIYAVCSIISTIQIYNLTKDAAK